MALVCEKEDGETCAAETGAASAANSGALFPRQQPAESIIIGGYPAFYILVMVLRVEYSPVN